MKCASKSGTRRERKGEPPVSGSLDMVKSAKQRAEEMPVAEIQKTPICHVSYWETERELRKFAPVASGAPRIVDPVTFAELARKIGAERSDLLRKLAE